MTSSSKPTEKILEKAKALGASIAGIAKVEDVKVSPSHLMYPKIGSNLDVHWRDMKDVSSSDEVDWPQDAVAAVVIGVEHNANALQLDWWDGKGTPGNRILIRINRDLSEWIEDTYDCKTYKLPYLIERGGIFLKDAAVMAGLGCIGRNNMVITPEYGPRIRFRALLLNKELEPTGPIEFQPCESCMQPCRAACPVSAFENTVYSPHELRQSILPGTDGTYDRVTCNAKMKQDIDEAVRAMQPSEEEHQGILQSIDEFEGGSNVASKGSDGSTYCVKFCRECELSCPVRSR